MTKRTVTKTDIIGAIFRDFYDTAKGVTSVTLADASTSTIVTYTASFPDKTATSRSSYPILIVTPPEIDWSYFTLNKTKASGSIDIEIYTTKSESADLFADAIQTIIETNKRTLREYGILDLTLSSISPGEDFHGDIKLHIRTLTFTFGFIFDKTRGY